MTTYTSPNRTMRITDEVSGNHSCEMTIPSNARIRNKEIKAVLQDCLIFERHQNSIAMAVLTSFWWMFNESWEKNENSSEYGSTSYVSAFIYKWRFFMVDLEEKNEELHSLLSKLSDTQIKEVAGV